MKIAVSERQIEKVAVDRARVMGEADREVQRAMQLEPVRDREGNPSGQFTCQGGVANKALELFGSELGMFQPRQQSTSLTIEVTRARLHAGRARVAEAKRLRDAAALASMDPK